MKKQLLFYLTGGILLLQSCGGAPSKRVQVQNNDTISVTEIKTDTIIYDTTNFKTMKSQEKYSVIKRFDIARYNKNKSRDGLNVGIYEFSDLNGMLVKQRHSISEANGETYIDERHYPDSPYLYSCVYYPNGEIKVSLTEFYSMLIGKCYDYDTSGNIAKEIDEDAPYKFSIDDLILKMKREYNLDIEDESSDCRVYRYKIDGNVFYELVRYASMPLNTIYLINGDNGKTLYVTEIEIEWYPGKSEETVYQQYKRVKKIK